MKIVAFLQNPFLSGASDNVIVQYRDDQKFHRSILKSSMSGGRLFRAFGDLFDEIWWDNASWKPGTDPVPDHEHVYNVLVTQNPDLVLCFGNQARDALILQMVEYESASGHKVPQLLQCHHPNARGKTQQDLDDFSTLVRRKMLEHDLLGQKRKMSEETL